MFEFLFRKIFLNRLSKDDQDISMLLRYRMKSWILAKLFVLLFFEMFPIELFAIFTVINNRSIIIFGIFAIVYCVVFESLKIKYYSKVQNFYTQMAMWLYVHRYVLRGKAISREDFKQIRKQNKSLYEFMVNLQTNSYCYSICFDILDCLAKGEILFVAIRISSKSSNYKYNNNYTMHVLYVFDDWCYDTYSEMQYPLEEVLKRSKAKVYKSFSYKDIQGKTYYEFRKEHLEELR